MNTEQKIFLDEQSLSIIRASNEMDSTLLITGSTGTGKSHLAHLVHTMNLQRKNNRWCKINLATLSENLIESELFGHERGAFTGADVRRVGKLEICNGGTVFLDEIGELSLRLQTKLLDFIQYKKITPVGSNRELELNVKIVVATNKNLEVAVKEGSFRADLYHRLNVFHIRIPDLSVNPKVIPDLITKFIETASGRIQKPVKKLSRQALHVLKMYKWPGNIRELENAIEYAVAFSDSLEITVKDLPMQLRIFAKECLNGDEPIEIQKCSLVEEEVHKEMRAVAPENAIALIEVPISLDFYETKRSFEKAYLNHVLRVCGGQINLTSRRIGLNKVSLTEKVKRYGIDWRKLKSEVASVSSQAS